MPFPFSDYEEPPPKYTTRPNSINNVRIRDAEEGRSFLYQPASYAERQITPPRPIYARGEPIPRNARVVYHTPVRRPTQAPVTPAQDSTSREPMSRRSKWAIVGCVLVLGIGGVLFYQLFFAKDDLKHNGHNGIQLSQGASDGKFPRI